MTVRRCTALAAVWIVAVISPSMADDDTSSGTSADGLWVRGAEHSAGSSGRNGNEAVDDPSPSQPSLLLGSGGCASADQAAGQILNLTYCPASQTYAEPVLTTGLLRRAFAELPLPAGELVVQPPDGITLVNFDTNFYTTSTRPIARTVTLLGQRVTLEATPARFHWDFDDGRTLSTDDPGAPYPRLDVTHNYLRTGTYRPSLSTTYTGRFRVGGGAWQEIPGTVRIDGTGEALRAIEAEPKLVGY